MHYASKWDVMSRLRIKYRYTFLISGIVDGLQSDLEEYQISEREAS